MEFGTYTLFLLLQIATSVEMWKTAPSALQEGEKVTGEEGIKGCWISEVMKNQFNLAKEIPGSLAVERGIRAAPGPDMTRYEELVIDNYN